MTEISTLAGASGHSEAARPERNQLADAYPGSAGSFTLRSQRARAEIHAIREALERTGWVRKRAARMLAISYRSLLYKIERYKITRASTAVADEPPVIAASQHAGADRRVA